MCITQTFNAMHFVPKILWFLLRTLTFQMLNDVPFSTDVLMACLHDKLDVLPKKVVRIKYFDLEFVQTV